jgi:hypothetical protein
MDRSAYDETLALLSAAGVPTRRSRYDHHAFGSWWIEVATAPPLRIGWDGKERWAIVQSATAKRPPPWDSDPWEYRWIGRKPEEQTPAMLVRVVAETARKNGHD